MYVHPLRSLECGERVSKLEENIELDIKSMVKRVHHPAQSSITSFFPALSSKISQNVASLSANVGNVLYKLVLENAGATPFLAHSQPSVQMMWVENERDSISKKESTRCIWRCANLDT